MSENRTRARPADGHGRAGPSQPESGPGQRDGFDSRNGRDGSNGGDGLERREGAGAGIPAGRMAYSVAEVAMITGLSRDLLYDQMRAGHLAYVKVGRRRIISRQHLEAFLARGAA